MNLAPNGKPSNLTPKQYKLVRTPEFKAWFGDWEKLTYAKMKDSAMDDVTMGNLSKDVSKVVDENGEPLVLHRGNLVNQEELGYTFNLGQNFLKKQSSNEFGFFFSNEIDIAKKYMLVDHFDEIKGGSITSVFMKSSNKILDLLDFDLKIGQDYFVQGLIEKGISFDNEYNYLQNKILDFNSDNHKGWGYNVFDYFDVFPELRNLFIENGFTSVVFYEMSRVYSKYKVFVAFEPTQIKLADGSNTTFDSNNNDIRFDGGGLVGNVFTKNVYIIRLSGGDWFEDYNSVYDDYEDALNDYNKISNSDFDIYENSKGLVKTLSEKTLKYKFVAEIDENDNINDYTDTRTLKDKTFWEIIDGGEWNFLEEDSVERVNEKADKLLSDVYNHYGKKYNTIYLDEDETISLKLRIADHSGKWKNKGSEDYFLSIVISDKNPTEDFYTNSPMGLNREEEEVFSSENTFEEIIEFINEKIKYYKEKSNIRFDDGGEVKSDYIKRVKEAIKYVENSPKARMRIDFEDEEGDKQAINEGKDYERIFPLKSKSNSFIVKKIREGVQDKYYSIGTWNEKKKSYDYRYSKNEKYGDKSKEFDTLQIAIYDEKGKIVGILKIATSENKKEDVKKGSFKIAVRQDYQNKGIASKLIEKAEREGIDFVEALKNNNFTSEGRWYFTSWLNKKLKNKVKYKYSEGGMPKKVTFNSIGSAIGFGTIPMIEGHDMIAECDCGERFTYQNSKKDILWQCPKCNVKKGF